jgi:hypothetical protein
MYYPKSLKIGEDDMKKKAPVKQFLASLSSKESGTTRSKRETNQADLSAGAARPEEKRRYPAIAYPTRLYPNRTYPERRDYPLARPYSAGITGRAYGTRAYSLTRDYPLTRAYSETGRPKSIGEKTHGKRKPKT